MHRDTKGTTAGTAPATASETAPRLSELARAIARHATTAGDHESAIPALSLHRRHAPTEPIPCIYPLGLALTTQGDKQVTVGDRVLEYFPGQSLVTTIDLPAVSYITRAATREPYLGLLLRLDARAIALAALELKLPPVEPANDHAPMSIERLDPALLDALCRLVDLLDDPILRPRLAPLIQEEIVVRLLTGPHGPHLRQLATADSPKQQIARVVTWIKQNFTKTIPMDALATKANMSPSTFRQHFRDITGMSPLQYQKQLRLQESRQLMLNRNVDTGRAADMVGYKSASQFSREYARLFGAPPQRDIRRMRSTSAAATAE